MAERRPFVNGTFAVAAAALRASPTALSLALVNAGLQVNIRIIYIYIYACVSTYLFAYPSRTTQPTHQQPPNTQVAWLLLWAVAAYGWAIDRSPPYIQIGDTVFDPDNCMQDVGACVSWACG